MIKPKSHIFFYAAQEMLVQLWERWLDEREYEDIADYAKPLSSFAKSAGVKIVKMTKRPFGVVIESDTGRYHVKVNSRAISMEAVR